MSSDRPGLSKEQIDRIEQFEADYNAVDHFLRKALGTDKLGVFQAIAGAIFGKTRVLG